MASRTGKWSHGGKYGGSGGGGAAPALPYCTQSAGGVTGGGGTGAGEVAMAAARTEVHPTLSDTKVIRGLRSGEKEKMNKKSPQVNIIFYSCFPNLFARIIMSPGHNKLPRFITNTLTRSVDKL